MRPDRAGAGLLDGHHPAVWARALDLFSELVEQPEDARAARLDALRTAEPDVHQCVVDLLKADGHTTVAGLPLAEQAMHDLLAEDADALLGAELGQYTIRSLLGEGGMGRVYLADTRDIQRPVAVKIVRNWRSRERQAQFQREKANLARVSHAGIAQLFHADQMPDGTAYFVMEYVDGLHITAFCSENKLPLRARLALFLQVCRVLQVAHGKLIVHRDLKPSNILVTRDGGVKLLDFGVSENLQGAAGPLRFVSLPYAPPEFATGPADVRGDVYSLGVLLCEMITGSLPFGVDCRSAERMRACIAEGRLLSPSTFASGNGVYPELRKLSAFTWRDLDVLCSKACALDPANRYATVETLSEDVSRFLESKPLRAARRDWLMLTRKYTVRHRRSVLLAGAVLLLMAGLIAGYTWRLRQARDAAVAAAQHSNRIEGFIQTVFSGGEGDAGPAKDLTVLTLLDRGVKSAEALNTDPATQADFYQTLGSVYTDLGETDRGEVLLGRSVALRKRMFGARSAPVAAALAELSETRSQEGRLDEARELGEQAVALDRRTLPANDPQTLRTETALAQIYSTRGDQKRAVSILEAVIRLEEGRPDSLADLSTAENNLGIAEFQLGHLDAAEIANQQSLAIDRKQLGDRHPDIAAHLLTLAQIESARGNYAQAAQYARQALGIESDWYGPVHSEVASALTTLADALLFAEKPQEALPFLQRALDVESRLPGGMRNRGVAHTLDALGMAARDLGHLDEALSYLQRALAIYREISPESYLDQGAVIANIARVQLQAKHYARAEALFREAGGLQARQLPQGDIRLVEDNGQVGFALLGEGRYDEAESVLLTAYQALQVGPPRAKRSLPRFCHQLELLYEAKGDQDRAAYFRARWAQARRALEVLPTTAAL